MQMLNKFFKLVFTSGPLIIGAASASSAMTPAECETRYTAADTAKQGYLTEKEAPAYFAMYRVTNKVISDGKLMKDIFLKDCSAGIYDAAANDKDAPLSGANSFTEGQAKDRILAHGGADVSPLKKDDKGIWRGTAKLDNAQENVAVDYKGNVVFTK